LREALSGLEPEIVSGGESPKIVPHLFLFQHVDSILTSFFPYSNWMKILSLTNHELQFVADVLSQDPYGLQCYTRFDNSMTPCIEDAYMNFAVITFECIFHPQTKTCIEPFYFGVENSLQDLTCFHLIQKVMGPRYKRISRDNFLDMILQLPQVGDILRDRIGFVHMGYFDEIWRRLVVLQEKLL
jgi:hypothetical protein